MAKEVFNRHEAKYRLNEEQFKNFHNDIKEYLKLDEYNQNNKFYTIYSLYIDSINNDLIRKSLDKPKYKEKLRIRSYNPFNNDELVYLEIKKKYRGFVNKRRTKMTYEEALQFIEHKDIELKSYMNAQVVKEIKYILQRNKYIPTTQISYKRLAYFSKDDPDLRVTFDCDVVGVRDDISTSLLDNNQYLMEIKVGKSFPIWLNKLLSKHKIYKQSFSKYGREYICAIQENKIRYTSKFIQNKQEEINYVRYNFKYEQ